MNETTTVLVSACLIFTTGCSVNRAFSHPPPRDLSFVTQGTARDTIRAELGDFTISSDSALCDVHAFPEGSGGFKYVRGITYSLLDVSTLGLAEIITNPLEASIGNDNMTLRACYNESNQLQHAVLLEKEGEVPL